MLVVNVIKAANVKLFSVIILFRTRFSSVLPDMLSYYLHACHGMGFQELSIALPQGFTSVSNQKKVNNQGGNSQGAVWLLLNMADLVGLHDV